MRRISLAMAWIDYRKAYDVVLQSCITDSLKLYKISDEVENFIEKRRKNWREELTAGGKTLTEVKIQRDIFQRDALSQLLFVIAMTALNHILRKCIGEYTITKLQEKSTT